MTFPKRLAYMIEILKSDYLDHSIYVQVYPCSAHIKRSICAGALRQLVNQSKV